jgi:hypothetical protein
LVDCASHFEQRCHSTACIPGPRRPLRCQLIRCALPCSTQLAQQMVSHGAALIERWLARARLRLQVRSFLLGSCCVDSAFLWPACVASLLLRVLSASCVIEPCSCLLVLATGASVATLDGEACLLLSAFAEVACMVKLVRSVCVCRTSTCLSSAPRGAQVSHSVTASAAWWRLPSS